TALDDLSTSSLENLREARAQGRFRFVRGTVLDPRRVRQLVERGDAVVHLAAAVGVMLVVKSPVRTIETNIRGTEVILEAAARRKVPVLLASTSEVYGKGRAPFSEDDDTVLGPPDHARWAYAASKLVDEFLALAYWKERGLPVVIARLFNTVGPRQTGRYGMVVPRLVTQALAGGPLTVYGDGRQTRCFAHVDDVTRALEKLLVARRARGRAVNVGSDEELSIGALARLVRRRVNPKASITRVPYRRAYGEGFEDLRRRVPDLSRIRGLIGWKPRHRIEHIIDSVAESLR
ncbi:MAG TPA: NAD-dependent epimerase/dehydratase family protein, partial [Planctomycetota bacterium]|nr:NAD-dependent epimerase/dehydratase family protein [Planctomycetota bacterium]